MGKHMDAARQLNRLQDEIERTEELFHHRSPKRGLVEELWVLLSKLNDFTEEDLV